jgi:hypothetical protein
MSESAAPGEPTDARSLFARGAEHWNATRFFEAHEDWETLWNDAVDPERLWLQGMIQLAAAFVHFERGFHASGFVRLVQSGREKIEGYAGETHGLDFARLQRDLAPWYAHAAEVAKGRGLRSDAPPLPVLRLGRIRTEDER